ncbi:hypothetical protein BGZ49_005519 [Haplosporangium sp. Z 27]|nr:hypothetical protein BGZ49_005519 [Haplosporangium sp. Z 27]
MSSPQPLLGDLRQIPDLEEIISLLISLGCITLMSVLFGRKTAGTKLGTINYARGLGPSKGKLRDVARRTLIGCLIALILSSANVFTLVYFEGNERGLLCLSSCTADVTLNAITVHWATSRASSNGGRGGHNAGARRTLRSGPGTTLESSNNYVSPMYEPHTFSTSEKQLAANETHITVEAYVEEYHSGLHINPGIASSSSSS